MAQVKPVSKKKLSGPSIAAIIVSVAILLGLIISLVASTGIFTRVKSGVESENFKINGSMMEYYANSIYQSWYSNYYYYILLGYIKFDASTPLSEQTLPSMFQDDEKPEIKTYYDYFVSLATTQMTKLLKYCEAARVDSEVNYSELEAEAKEYAESTIKSLKESAKKNSTDFTNFLRQNFGEHVSKSDLYDALVIEHIASDYSNIVHDRIYDGMTDERKEEYFKDNLHEFISAEYLTYTTSQPNSAESVDEKDYVTDEYPTGKDNPEYLAAVEKAKEDAKKANALAQVAAKELVDKLATAKSAEEFKRILLDEKYEENFKSAYDTAVKNFADTDKPSDEDYKAFMNEVKQKIIDAVIAGESDIASDDKDEDEDKSESTDEQAADVSKWDSAKKELPASVITKLKSVITNATKTATFYEDKTAFEKNKELNTFLFAGVKAQFGVKYEDYETEGESAKVNDYLMDNELYEDNEDKQAIGAYSYTVYFVTEAAHRDEQILRNVGHILFQVDEDKDEDDDDCYASFDEAKAAADKIYAEILATAKDGKVDKDTFETIGKEHTSDSSVFYENVNKGDMVDEFDAWLFDESRTLGELGLVKTEDYGWHIMYYNGEGDVAWREDAHESATDADLTDWFEALPYEITVNEALYEDIFG